MIYCGVVNGFANEGVELLQSKEFRALIGEAFLMLLLLSSHKWSTAHNNSDIMIFARRNRNKLIIIARKLQFNETIGQFIIIYNKKACLIEKNYSDLSTLVMFALLEQRNVVLNFNKMPLFQT